MASVIVKCRPALLRACVCLPSWKLGPLLPLSLRCGCSRSEDGSGEWRCRHVLCLDPVLVLSVAGSPSPAPQPPVKPWNHVGAAGDGGPGSPVCTLDAVGPRVTRATGLRPEREGTWAGPLQPEGTAPASSADPVLL